MASVESLIEPVTEADNGVFSMIRYLIDGDGEPEEMWFPLEDALMQRYM